jgi:hypothetical protein
MKTKITFFLLIFAFYKANSQDSDLFNYNNSLKFAEYLYKSGEYSLAIPEFKRILFIDSTNIKANIKVNDCFIRLGKYADGMRFSNLTFPKLPINDTLSILRGKLFILNNDFAKLESEILTKPISPQGLVYLKTSEYMFNKDWKSAQKSLNELNKFPDLTFFTPIINKALTLKYKKPAISLALSAVIPGAGKVYSGYWRDGLFSFLFVGISAWQSYRGFSKNGVSSAYGWLMGGISLSFYSGNLYGSVKAANKYNHQLDHSVLDNFEKAFLSTYSNF